MPGPLRLGSNPQGLPKWPAQRAPQASRAQPAQGQHPGQQGQRAQQPVPQAAPVFQVRRADQEQRE
ncbi:MAG: hypothetical protein ACJ8BF_09900 [Gemmatimonadales bacterium]